MLSPHCWPQTNNRSDVKGSHTRFTSTLARQKGGSHNAAPIRCVDRKLFMRERQAVFFVKIAVSVVTRKQYWILERTTAADKFPRKVQDL